MYVNIYRLLNKVVNMFPLLVKKEYLMNTSDVQYIISA